MSVITDLEPLIQQSSTFVDKANGIKLMPGDVICVFKGPLNILSPLSACLHMCAITRASTPAFDCTRSCMCVFINRANGFSAGPTFVCSVTQPGSRFMRQVFGAEAQARAVNDPTPVSGRRGPEGEKSMIDLALRHRDIWSLSLEKGMDGMLQCRELKREMERRPV